MTKRAFVTGACGFVGANLARALPQHGRRVRVLVRPSSDLRNLPDEADAERSPGRSPGLRIPSPRRRRLRRSFSRRSRLSFLGRESGRNLSEQRSGNGKPSSRLPRGRGQENRVHLDGRDHRSFVPTRARRRIDSRCRRAIQRPLQTLQVASRTDRVKIRARRTSPRHRQSKHPHWALGSQDLLRQDASFWIFAAGRFRPMSLRVSISFTSTTSSRAKLPRLSAEKSVSVTFSGTRTCI